MATPSTDKPSTVPVPRRRGRPVRIGLHVLLGLLGLVIAVALMVPALLRTEAASSWLLKRVPGLTLESTQGALLGDRLTAERLVWVGPAGRLELQGLEIRGLGWLWRPAPGQWLGLRAEAVTLQGLGWQSAPSEAVGPQPLSPPATLRLPIGVSAPLQIARAEIDALAPLLDIAATLDLGTDGGAVHRIQDLALRWDRLRATGTLQIDAVAPFALQAQAQLASAEGAPQPWQATLQADGPLDRLAVSGTLRSQDDAASVDLTATLTPFAPWPLAALSARTEGLDLARLSSAWPKTLLDGQATLNSQALDAPFEATLTLANRQPGRWNEARLPLRRAQITLRALLAEPDRVQIEAFDFGFGFGDAVAEAGRWWGQGEWRGHMLTLSTRMEGLAPERLDGRAAAMRLAGQLAIEVQGLPSPDPQASPPAGTPLPAWSVSTQGQLTGRTDAAPAPVNLVVDARAAADTLELRSLQARVGDASADATATLRRQGAAWALTSEGRLNDFNPLPWWSGPADGTWRQGPHRWNGNWTLALTLPDAAQHLPLAERWQRVAGEARARIEDSVLAGLPVSAEASLGADQRLQARVDLAGNRLQLDGRADPQADGEGDRWQLDLQAPALARLAPLARLFPTLVPAAAEWAPQAGRADGTLALRGRWPAVSGEGRVTVQDLRAGPLHLARGELDATLPDGPGAALSATLSLGGAEWRNQLLSALDAELSGTLAAHRLTIDAALPLLPPAALSRSLALETMQPAATAGPSGTRVSLRGDGSLVTDADGSRWTGQLAALTAGPWDGRQPLTGTAPTAWMNTSPVRADLAFAPDGRLLELRADAGRLQAAGDLSLVWQEVRYGAAGWAVQAELEAFRLAPLLARWQPELGWDGGLRLGGRIDVSAGERFAADIVFERLDGDLQVRDGTGAALPLGLSDLRLALTAQDGTWYFTQALAGRTLGELGGALRVITSPAARWPAATDPLDGSLQARVANLGIWGAWVPPGWRLAGSLQTQATFGGAFGAPEVRGELSGTGLGVRNLLQGVNVTGGDVLVRLQGERATIERFRFDGGKGSLALTGGAELGATPRADITLVADGFQVLGRVDRRLVASGRATLQLQPDALVLNGGFSVDEGLFDTSRSDAPSLDDDVVVRRPDTPATADAIGPRAAPKRRIAVALDIDLGQRLKVRGRGLDTWLDGTLRISAPAGRLAVNGTVNTRSGTYAAYGQKLQIERGVVAFSGAADNPRLDVLALRPNLDIEVGVAITGTALSPRVRLHSNPELSDTDKLAWLVLGRDPGGLERADTALLQRAALGLLAGEGEAPTDSLIRNLGLDEVSVRQSDGEVRETIVTLGKQLSQRWYVGYERGVNATTGTWQLIYRAAQRFTLRAQSGLDNSLDLIWVFRRP